MKTLRAKLFSIWTAFLSTIHLYTKSHHDKACSAIRTLYEAQIENMNKVLDGWKVAYDQAANAFNKASAELEDTKSKMALLEEKVKDFSAMEKKVAVYKTTASANLEYVDNVQKQLAGILEKSPEFGFPKSVPVPGSTSIKNYETESEGDKFEVLRFRVMAFDDTTYNIHQNPDMESRIGFMLNHLKQYGGMEKIAERLIYSGAVALTLGYNENSTVFSLYAEAVLKKPEVVFKVDNTVKIDGEEG